MKQIDIEKSLGNKKQSATGSVISFHDVSYAINQTKALVGCCGKSARKDILTKVNGIMKPGLNAIMGPTGSGKSSLLDVLAARKDPRWLTGKVRMNSKKLPSNYKYLTGYVVQNNILMGNITVRESLWFSANMRLSSTLSYSEKETRVEELLEQLALEKCANTKVGNYRIRGISGGERKRTAIALELITGPSVLFLDEPTTGLDASTANTVMRLLKKLANDGQTVVASIHQPRYSIFRLFDSITLLSLGQCIYHGNASSALPYIESLGYECETHNNPADFFLDVINGEIELNSDVKRIEFNQETKHKRHIKTTEKLLENFTKSDQNTVLQCELENIKNTASYQVKEPTRSNRMYATSFFVQLKHLLRRDFMNIIRDPSQGLSAMVVINMLLGLIFGLLYFQIDNSPNFGTQNRSGVMFFVISNVLFSSTAVIDSFIKERDLFVHENTSGYYRVISYLLSKLFADLLPMRTITPIFFSIITYWMVGLKPNATALFVFLLVNSLCGYGAVAMGMFFAVVFKSYYVANMYLVLVLIFSVVFSGVLVQVKTMLSWLSWLQYLSIARYGLVGLSVNEFMGETFSQCYNASEIPDLGNLGAVNFTKTFIGNQTCVSVSGEQYLHEYLGIGSSADTITLQTMWLNVLALACITVGIIFATYIQLLRTNKYS